MGDIHRPSVSTEERQALADNLSVSEFADTESLTLTTLRDGIETETDAGFVSMSQAVRDDLTDTLDTDRIDASLDEMETQLERLPGVRDVGIPDGKEQATEVYRERIAPAWEVYDHLVDVGFFESLESNLPAFTPDHIEQTAHELIGATPLREALAGCGFDEHEQLVLLLNVVNNETRLSRWVPTRDIPEGVEFNVENVPPLHQRSMGGALLWIKALDHHLWQNEILITEDILDDAFWYTKAMLGGLYLMARGARAIATGDGSELTDAQAMVALSGGSAVLIVNQEEMMKDVFWITEENRAPTPAR